MRDGVLAAGMWDLVTLVASANESGNDSMIFVKWSILLTSNSVWFVRGSG